MVARLSCGLDLRKNGGDVVSHLRAGAHGGQRGSGVPVQATGMAKSQVGLFQTPGQLRRHGAQLHGVTARLKDRQDAR